MLVVASSKAMSLTTLGWKESDHMAVISWWKASRACSRVWLGSITEYQ